jgi:DNA-binding MarR family transcriptional regulator
LSGGADRTIMGIVPKTLPLPTLLSSALVAFTIEFDNEAEHRMTHRATASRDHRAPSDGPWLTSQVMWANVLQYIDQGCTVAELHERARTTHDSLRGLHRWGYIRVTQTGRVKASGPVPLDASIRLTLRGHSARQVWENLAAHIEARWVERFGLPAIDTLRASLQAVLDHVDLALPCYIPIVHPTQNGRAEQFARRDRSEDTDLDLSVLLARVLLAFTVDFERSSRISLPISATTLRVLTAAGVRVRDLPALTGVSPEGNTMCAGFLARIGCATLEPIPAASRGKQLRLTPKGLQAQQKYHRVLAATEEEWRHRFGKRAVAALHAALTAVVGIEPTAALSPLFGGLTPYPEGWRARVRCPDTLPHYPMVLHRGGYPDGS